MSHPQQSFPNAWTSKSHLINRFNMFPLATLTRLCNWNEIHKCSIFHIRGRRSREKRDGMWSDAVEGKKRAISRNIHRWQSHTSTNRNKQMNTKFNYFPQREEKGKNYIMLFGLWKIIISFRPPFVARFPPCTEKQIVAGRLHMQPLSAVRASGKKCLIQNSYFSIRSQIWWSVVFLLRFPSTLSAQILWVTVLIDW